MAVVSAASTIRLRGRINLENNLHDFLPISVRLFSDEQHAVTYVRLLDAEKANADWQQVVQIVLQIDPVAEPERARRAYDSHLARAKWVARHGYRELLKGGWPKGE